MSEFDDNLQFWGLLAPEYYSLARRTRSLGLGRLVRYYNDKAVPGMGGVWFLKQIYLSMFGIALARAAVAGRFRSSNIQTANALEALTCWLSFNHTGWEKRDPRLKGVNKIRYLNDLSFKNLSREKVYVTQPFRMRTVSALPSLGLVESPSMLFNSYELSDLGNNLLENLNEDFKVGSRPVFEFLLEWVQEKKTVLGYYNLNSLRLCLSPLEDFNFRKRNALKQIVLHQGVHGDIEKRRRIFSLLDMYSERGRLISWKQLSHVLGEPHSLEIREGASFFRLRELVIGMLNKLEENISVGTKTNCLSINEATRMCKVDMVKIREAALEYKDLCNFGLNEARQFISECEDSKQVIAAMVGRDGRGLFLQGEQIVPGAAFRGGFSTPDTGSEEVEDITAVQKPGLFPMHVSQRLINMFYLNKDFKGKLGKWLKQNQ